RFGQGPLELDAAMFLATVTRTGLLDAAAARAAASAAAVFLAGTRPFLDGDALVWYRVAALLRLARRQLKRRKDDWRARARVLLGEAARLLKRSEERRVGKEGRSRWGQEQCKKKMRV